MINQVYSPLLPAVVSVSEVAGNGMMLPRKRSRETKSSSSNARFVAAGILYSFVSTSYPMFQQALALSSPMLRTTTHESFLSPVSKEYSFSPKETSSFRSDNKLPNTFNQLFNDDNDDDEEEEDSHDASIFYFSVNNDDSITDSVASFLKLKKSSGSDVLQTELQTQIDAGGREFLEIYGKDASNIEKLAMSSVTEQLPQPAVQRLTNTEENRKKQTLRRKKGDTNFATDHRVSVAEEIQLARFIQLGAALNQIKKNTEIKLERELSKNEWAELAGISPRELRRRISDYRKAKHDLVNANIGLVHTIVKQQWYSKFKNTGISYDELVQEGCLGLIRAAELFDPNRGLRFSTYAVVWIKGTLQNSHVPELVKLPSRDKTKWNKIIQATKYIQKSQGMVDAESFQPGYEQLSAVTGLSIPEILETQRRMGQTKQIFSLDYEQNTHSRSGMESSVSTTDVQDDFEVELQERTQMHADLIAAMARNLDPREARLMRLRYGLSEDGRTRTLHECADAMGISYTRANQLAHRCLEKLRQAAEARSLEEYLLTIA